MTHWDDVFVAFIDNLVWVASVVDSVTTVPPSQLGWLATGKLLQRESAVFVCRLNEGQLDKFINHFAGLVQLTKHYLDSLENYFDDIYRKVERRQNGISRSIGGIRQSKLEMAGHGQLRPTRLPSSLQQRLHYFGNLRAVSWKMRLGLLKT